MWDNVIVRYVASLRYKNRIRRWYAKFYYKNKEVTDISKLELIKIVTSEYFQKEIKGVLKWVSKISVFYVKYKMNDE